MALFNCSDIVGKHTTAEKPLINRIQEFNIPTHVNFKRPIDRFSKLQNPQLQSPLLQLPTEIRLIILGYLINPPKVLYNWWAGGELKEQNRQNRDALLVRGLQVKTFLCCQLLLAESRTVLYGTTVLQIQCHWVGQWSRVAIGGGRLMLGCVPSIQKEQPKYGSSWTSPGTQTVKTTTSVPSFMSASLFRKIKVSMIDNFLDPAFREICDVLKYLVAGKDAVITIRRPFPAAVLDSFSGWKCKSIMVNDTRFYPELKSIQDLINENLQSH